MSQAGTRQATKQDYKDGRTKQSFKDETDINKILQRAQVTGTISHLAKYEARYGDFSSFDFLEAQIKLSEGRTMFAELPSEIRREFNQSPPEFFDYVNDPANAERLEELLPALAQPGRQNISTKGNIPADTEKAALEAAQALVKSAEEKKEPEASKEPEPLPKAPEAPPVLPT